MLVFKLHARLSLAKRPRPGVLSRYRSSQRPVTPQPVSSAVVQPPIPRHVDLKLTWHVYAGPVSDGRRPEAIFPKGKRVNKGKVVPGRRPVAG